MQVSFAILDEQEASGQSAHRTTEQCKSEVEEMRIYQNRESDGCHMIYIRK